MEQKYKQRKTMQEDGEIMKEEVKEKERKYGQKKG
jgi:hypothetical protein